MIVCYWPWWHSCQLYCELDQLLLDSLRRGNCQHFLDVGCLRNCTLANHLTADSITSLRICSLVGDCHMLVETRLWNHCRQWWCGTLGSRNPGVGTGRGFPLLLGTWKKEAVKTTFLEWVFWFLKREVGFTCYLRQLWGREFDDSCWCDQCKWLRKDQ